MASESNGKGSVAFDVQAANNAVIDPEDRLLLHPKTTKPKGCSAAVPLWLSVAFNIVLSVSIICLSIAVAALGSKEYSPRVIVQPTADDTTMGMTFPLQVDDSRDRCSGNGILYATEISCRCFDCFTGPSCQVQIPISVCNVTSLSGTPVIFEEYWLQHPAAEVRIRASDHLGYESFPEPLEEQLKDRIRRLHALVGNAVTDGHQIVFGIGSTELINAALYALSERNSTGPTMVYARTPYYGAYRSSPRYFASTMFQWTDVAPAAGQRAIEFVTSPNNPDGEMRTASVPGAYVVYDHAYYWPHFVPISGPMEHGDNDISLYTLSKMTGHAGSRIGWALVKNTTIASNLMMHIVADHSGMPSDAMVRALSILDYVLGSKGEVLTWAAAEMQRRWTVLEDIFQSSTRFSLQSRLKDQHDTWLGRNRDQTPAYVWLRCINPQRDPDCHATLLNGGVMGIPAAGYGAGPEYVRLELLMRARLFDMMAEKLRAIAA